MSFAIVHVDIDAFFAAVEQARDPRLRGRPVIVGNGVIASCSYEARRFGLHAGMSLSRARHLCPRVVILDGHYPTYRSFAERVYRRVASLTPSIDTYLDECYGDLTGTERLHGDLIARARELRQEIQADTGITVTVGLGPNRMLAKMVGKGAKPDGLAWITEDQADSFLAGRPVGDLLGVGPAHRRTLESMNVQTVADLRRLPRETLVAVFGVHGGALYERARGRDSRAVTTREVPVSISRESAFAKPTVELDAITGMLSYLAGRAARTARGLGIAPRTIDVRLRYEDGVAVQTAVTLPQPSALDDDIFPRVEVLFDRLHTRRVRLVLVGVGLTRFATAGDRQLDLLADGRDRRAEALTGGLDEVRSRFGDGVMISGRSLHLLGRWQRDNYGFILRTPSLAK
jgi:DNA polymerase-4